MKDIGLTAGLALFVAVASILFSVLIQININGANNRLDRLITCMSGSGAASALVCAQQDRDGPTATCSLANADLWTDWHCRQRLEEKHYVLPQQGGTGTVCEASPVNLCGSSTGTITIRPSGMMTQCPDGTLAITGTCPSPLDGITGGVGQLYIATPFGTNDAHGYGVTCGFSKPAPLSSGDHISCDVQ